MCPKMPIVRKPKTPVAAWIVEQRKALGWKSEELAARLGVSESAVRGWESNRPVSSDNLAALERLYGVVAPGQDESSEGDVAAAIREQAASNDRLAKAMETQAEAFTTLAASIDRAAAGVVGQVGGFGHLLRDLLAAAGATGSEAPDGAQSRGPHAPVER